MPESAQQQYWNSTEHFKHHSMRSFNFLCQAALTHNNLGKFYPNESGNYWHSGTKIGLDLLYLLSPQCLPLTVKAKTKSLCILHIEREKKNTNIISNRVLLNTVYYQISLTPPKKVQDIGG